ncbi:ABC transporter ATP-binding protein [Candidatus Omnitrophota bacterium]
MNPKTSSTLWFFIKDYKRYVFFVFLLSILFAIFEGLNVALLLPLVSSILNQGAVATSGKIAGVLNVLMGILPIKDVFMSTCAFLIIAVILKNIFRYSYMVLSAFASFRIWKDVQKKLFAKYIKADYRYFLDHKHGEIVYRLYNAPARTGGVLKLIPQLAAEILKIIIISALLFSMSFPVTCIVVFIAGVFYLITRQISRKISYFLGKGRMEESQQQNILINEMINGIKQIKIFLAENKWTSSFYKAINNYFRLAKKDSLWINMPISVLETLAMTSLCVFLIFMRRFSPDNLLSNLPLIAVFAYAFQRVMPSLSMITNLRMQIMGGLPVLEILYSVLNEKMSYLKDGDKILDSFNEKIELRDVSFSYPGRPEALRGMSISFEKNKCTAIAGPSGSGKTTLVNLLIRLFDPTQGTIFVDNIDIKDYKKDSWLSKIGFVSQDTFIFHASVRDNIAFGLDEADMNQIVKAAQIANAHDFIINLPDGYDTIVGERGMKLSGGEQQRIAIARAVLRNPQILIFDEATSALDNVSQSLIQAAIQKIVKEHTVILIAHRLSTIVNADKIIVLDKGIIKETGSHLELVAKKGYYSRLYHNEKEFISVVQ